ncbi:TPA: bacteriocin immunity protein [Klebsiella quasipneumoniae]|nr:bacteriocin immunity protein [Klebsiella quasipneumoniae]
MELKNKLEDYTEAEFLEFLNKIWNIDVSSEEEHDKLIEHFSKITEHPQGNGLIFYPDGSREDSPEGVVKEVKEWRAANGKPGFKTV